MKVFNPQQYDDWLFGSAKVCMDCNRTFATNLPVFRCYHCQYKYDRKWHTNPYNFNNKININL